MVTMEKTKINTLHHLLPSLINRQPEETRMLTRGAKKGNANNRSPKVGYELL